MDKFILRKDLQKVKILRQSLLEVIHGQDVAVNAFSEAIFNNIITSRNSPRPEIFLFAGPPGVGKTLLANTAGKLLGRSFLSIDMSEYSIESDAMSFFGMDKGWKNAHAGKVTQHVLLHPESVVLFDEIEKAHTNVMHLFLGLLQTGKAYDMFLEKEVDFRNTILIFTTNVGRNIYESGRTNISSTPRELIIDAIETEINPHTKMPYFPSALCSRFASGCVLMFNHMSPDVLLDIVSSTFRSEAELISGSYNISIESDEDVMNCFLFAEGGNSDARRINGRIQNFVKKEFYELVNLINADSWHNLDMLNKVKFTADYKNAPEEIVHLFDNHIKNSVLVLTESINPGSYFSKENNTELVSVNTYDDAVRYLKTSNVNMIITDFCCQLESGKYMCIDDFISDGRKLFMFAKEMFESVPVYVLETKKYKLNPEEKNRLMGKGATGFIDFDSDKALEFINDVFAKNDKSYVISAMNELSRSNKRLIFETSQEVSEDASSAEIRLYDFRLITAVSGNDGVDIITENSCPDVKFDDVIGADEAKEELEYFLEYLKNPKKFLELGVRHPKGVLLYGPPGTGKTMLAKAMAGEAGISFISTDGASLKNKYVGESGNNVRKLFRTARKFAPSIIFIDEVDAVAMDRKDSSSSERNPEALNALLTEMDGFRTNADKPVFVLAATNMNISENGRDAKGSIDPAFARRFDRKIYVDLPTRNDREKYLKMKNETEKLLDLSDNEISSIAERSAELSFAELENIIELSFRNAIRQGLTTVNDGIFEESFSIYLSGNSRKWSREAVERTAHHEAGHAIISWCTGKTPAYITVVSRGDYGGYVQIPEDEDIPTYSKEMLLDKIKVILGGMAAEIYFYGQYNTGISNDLSKAAVIAERMICDYGMYPESELGIAPINKSDNPVIDEKVRSLVNTILNEQLEEAKTMIKNNSYKITSLAAQLIEKNHLRKDELDNFFGSV